MNLTKDQFDLLDAYVVATVELKFAERTCCDGDNRNWEYACGQRREAREALERSLVKLE